MTEPTQGTYATAEAIAESFATDIRYLLAGGTSNNDYAERPPSARAQQAIEREKRE